MDELEQSRGARRQGPDAKELLRAIRAFGQAETWPESKRVVEQHPELLSDEADKLLGQLIAAALEQDDADVKNIFEKHRDLLRHCRSEGVDAAFAHRMQPATASGPAPDIPAEFEVEIRQLVELTGRAQRDPGLQRQRVALIKGMVGRLRPGQHPGFRAALLNDLGGAYANLPTGDRAADLAQAIACYREALRFYTPETAPFEYAGTQSNLGNAYLDLPTSDRAANLAQAIDCFREALRFRTPGAAPFDYAATQAGLGNAYASLPTDDRAADLGQAIACYREALRFRTPGAAPFDYAMTQNNLGNVYQNLPTDDRAADLAQAIACYQEALRFLTPETAPAEYAGTQNNLGAVYADLPTGNRAANLAQAIDCYQKALTIYTPKAAPAEYAMTQNNLGNAYLYLPTGDRAANLAQAIACYREALRFRTPGAARFDYAMTQNNLGNAYLDLPTGDRAANLKEAIACYQEALRFRTPGAVPFDYAMTQNNLGLAYQRLPTGNRAADLAQAIACYREALRFRTPEAAPFDYAITQNNLGETYRNFPTDDPAANLKEAIACFREALRFHTPEAAPAEYAMTQNNLGNAYRDLPVGDPAANLKEAITCFRETLRFLTPEAAPADHRGTARNLGNLYFGESRWEEAHTAYASAVAAGEALYHVAGTEVARQAELAAAPQLFPDDAYCLARLGRFTEAVERLEAGRARALAEALARDRAALEQAKPEDRAAFVAARERIKELEVEARATGTARPDRPAARSFVELSADLHAARQALAEVAERIRGYIPGFMPAGLAFPAIAAAAPAQPLVYLVTTSQGSLALIVPPGATGLDAKHAVWLDEFDSNNLVGLLVQRKEAVGGYLAGQLEGDVPLLQAALDQVLPVLRERLIGPLAARLAELDFRQATLIPGSQLPLLPLHAAAFETMTVTYAPSARALQAAHNAARERANLPPVLLGIGNPLPNPRPIAFARAEVEAIAPMFAPQARLVLYERQATREETLKKLPGATHLHFSCHGAFNTDEPLDSALYLSGEDTLSLRDLLDGDLDLSAARLAVLSACQTGITDFDKVPDEAVGLPAGFLQAGVPGVISTLWPVAAISTALLLARFYGYHLHDELDPATALHQAQAWLRDSSAAELKLADWYERQYRASGRQDEAAWEALQNFRDGPGKSEKPFAHPYYWAAFTFSGVSG